MEVVATSPPSINNVKVRVKVSKSALSNLKLGISKLAKIGGYTAKKKKIFQQHHNFVVYRGTYTYIVFCGEGTVNITGIPSYGKVKHAVKYFCQEFNVSRRDLTAPTVDNLTASGNFNVYIDLKILKQIINNQKNTNSLIKSASFNVEHFPACFCRTFSIGTISVFGSGKYNIVGAKCRKHVKDIFQAMTVYISKL
jgi:TATA-box binding protein (TBP) (component of TFIID and TFIIIB)